MVNQQRGGTVLVWLLVIGTIGMSGGRGLFADTTSSDSGGTTYRSAHCVMHTDLPAAEAREVLQRIEATLIDSADYWGSELTGCIECFVVHRLDQWHDRDLPHPMSRILIGRVGGAAIIERIGAGSRQRNRVYVLASSEPGVVEHEFVHAYCGQTFGTTGPIWYREGMAQLLAFGRAREQGVNCPPAMISQLQEDRPRGLEEVLSGDLATQQLLLAFRDKVAQRSEIAGLIPLTDWNSADISSLETAQESYAWNWLLCHLLHHNPNYRARFHSLGIAYLRKREDWFGRLFQPVIQELTFEYRFTLERLDQGYRVDLCHWEWEKPFRPLTGYRPFGSSVDAARGYQATGIELSAGGRYRYAAEGVWKLDQDGPAIDADGDVHGQGKLEAIVMQDYQLGEPFALGRQGEFRAPSSGPLYLRCRDDWNQISDNEGTIRVAFSR